MKPKGKKIYSVYDGDALVDVGTRAELSARTGLSMATLRWKSTPSSAKRPCTKYGLSVHYVGFEPDPLLPQLREELTNLVYDNSPLEEAGDATARAESDLARRLVRFLNDYQAVADAWEETDNG